MAVHPRLADRSCYHKYEIAPGLFTPGTFLQVEPRLCLDELGIPERLTGLKVLEISAFDGAFTFELARRGADVTALDICDPDITVFNAVRDILNLPVTYVRGSVYDLTRGDQAPFDMVVFTGVYYHLKKPALALQNIREVLRDGGMLYIEGASCSDYLGAELARAFAKTHRWPISPEELTELIDRLPISMFDEEHKIYPEPSNWWFPTTRCLEAMVRDSGFKDVQLALKKNAFYDYTHRRLMGCAVADPEKAHPGAQQYEGHVGTRDFKSDRLAKLLAKAERSAAAAARPPKGLRSLLRRARRKVARYLDRHGI
jgi:tRNA (mo5U34)-methyltransferase